MATMTDADFGKRVRMYRAAAGLSLSAAAREARIAKGFLSEIEAGRHGNPTARLLYRLAGALGVGLYDLVSAPEQGRTNPLLAGPTVAPADAAA